MVHWDPEAKTSLSDEEVLHKDVQAKLYYVRYEVVEKARHLFDRSDLASGNHHGRPRHRYQPQGQTLHGAARIARSGTLGGMEIPIITDEYVTPDFGTGCLKVTPAHDWNDFAIGQKHGLDVIDVLNEDGTLNEHGLEWAGMDRFAARKATAAHLEERGDLVKVETYASTGGNFRTHRCRC